MTGKANIVSGFHALFYAVKSRCLSDVHCCDFRAVFYCMNEKELVEAAASCLSNECVTLFAGHRVALFSFFPVFETFPHCTKLLHKLYWLLLFFGNIII